MSKAGTAAWFRRFLLVGVLSLCYSVPAFSQEIGEIRIEGNRFLEEETVKSYLSAKEGDSYDPDKITSDIHALYDSGFIKDVVVEKTYTTDTGRPRLLLIYRITEKPVVKEVRFEGADHLTEDELDSISDIKDRSVYDPAKVRNVRYKLLEEYAKQGYFMAKVDVEVKELGPKQVEVIFWIQEGKKPVVGEVNFYGNEEISDRKLKRYMKTKEEGAFVAKKYSQEDWERDQYLLDYFYEDRGYLESSFTPSERALTEDRRYVELGVGIEEGPQYKVGEIQVTGDLLIPEQEIMEGFKLESGDIFRKSYLMKDSQYLHDLYGVEGYALALIEPDLELDRENRIVDVTWSIHKGPKVYIERIEVTGNEKTYDKVVRRKLQVKEGQLFNTEATRQSRDRIEQLGYFKEVEIIPRRASESNRVVLDVAVKEARQGSLSAGAGVSSTSSEYFFSLQYQQKNFLGRGMNISARAMVSENTQTYYLDYSDPYFLDSEWYFGLNLFSRELYYVEFVNRRQGGRITVGREIPHLPQIRFYLSYSYLITDLESYESSSSIYRQQPSNTSIGSMEFTLERNTLNNYIDPSDGSKLSYTGEVAGHDMFGGENDYLKNRVEFWYFQPLIRETYMSFRSRASWMNYDQGDWLLISERYFLGGQYNMRGYEVATVSPMFREDNGDLTPIGGNKEAYATLEYIVPVAPEMGLKAAVFYDVGNVYNDGEPIDLTDVRQDWGFGVRWRSPMGPLRLEVAFPIDPRPMDDEHQFVFALGRLF
ncbi:MAG: outer membrane protein assembly factor BamA [bacterium]